MLSLVIASGTAVAQDSVSRNANGGNGLPGDATAPWATAYARVSYVLDLAPLQGSWGTPFGIGPVLKAGRINQSRFTAYNLAPTLSPSARLSQPYPASSFARWSAAGGGIHTTENNTALNTAVTPVGTATRFAIAALDVDEMLSGSSVYFANVLYGAHVAFDPAVPDRLYITRVTAAHNTSGPAVLDRSQFGLGAIDADGNLVFRADSFGSAGPATALLQGDNILRVRLPARSTAPNLIDASGASQAASTDWIAQNHPVTLAAPAAIPADLAGLSRAVVADFAGNLRLEVSPNTTTPTTAHRPGALDHRGSPAISAAQVFPNTAATGGMLTRSTGGGGKVDSISLWGHAATGILTSPVTLTLPASLTDACDAFAWPIAGGGFRGYDSQITFRGGVGPMAIGKDAAGRGLAAGVIYAGSTPNPAAGTNAIAVVRFNPANPVASAQWTVAAWVDAATMTGKNILGDFGADGAPGSGDAGEGDGQINALDAPIGRLAGLHESSLGLVGPSLSCPALDAAGNLYFIASSALKRWTGAAVVTDFDIALVRAVYDPDSFCYKLERLLRVGDVIAGRNAARNYRIASLSLADSDSVSSAALFSGSVASTAWNNLDPASLQPASPLALGGLVFIARVVYDVDQDGLFIDPTLPGANNASVDEAYNVTLYLGNITPPPPACDADVNCDGAVNGLDVEIMELAVGGDLSDFCQPDPDFNQDGAVNGLDVEAVELVVGGAPCP
ncbi:MAG: hypothetical protein HBSAPP03_12140 [Phycisphaerae bacterium]|nr:MAG: hypothetical protein HBSAPP03_12140 [Phycisphaerae bacterium]